MRISLGFARQGGSLKWSEDFGQLVRRTVEVVRPYASERGATIELDLVPRALPVQMSPIELEQVAVNLVRNSAESRSSGAHIRVRTRVDDHEATLDVIDDGRGISLEDQERVFDPFCTTRLRDGGTGMGLSVVRRVLKEHRGTIEISSTEDVGTRVTVRLPLAEQATENPVG